MTKTVIVPLIGDRQSSESDKAVLACNDFLRLGAGRTIAALAEKYEETPKGSSPTKSRNTLYKWHVDFKWDDRAALYDAEIEYQKEALAQESLKKYLALDYWRVEKLVRLADFLEQQIYEQGIDGDFHNVWLPDVKQIGSGNVAERVDLERFNAAIFQQYRGILEDIAKEVGGRIEKRELSGKVEMGFPKLVSVVDSQNDSSGS